MIYSSRIVSVGTERPLWITVTSQQNIEIWRDSFLAIKFAQLFWDRINKLPDGWKIVSVGQ